MGVAYRARDVALDRDVAGKLLSYRPINDSVGQFAISVEARRMFMVCSSLQRFLKSSWPSRRPTPSVRWVGFSAEHHGLVQIVGQVKGAYEREQPGDRCRPCDIVPLLIPVEGH